MKIARTQPQANDRKEDITEHFFRELDIQFLIHELKDPLGIILTVLRSLLERREKYGPLSPRQENALKRATNAVIQIQSLVHDLLEIGRSEALQFEYQVFRPKSVVYNCLLEALELMESHLFDRLRELKCENEALTFLAQANMYVKVTPEVEDLEILQDETKFRQIISNLIKNALRFRNKRLDITLRQEGEHLYVNVCDDGPGIKQENMTLIFQQYTQVNGRGALARKGHGLGLAGALLQARRLGGELTVESEVGQGARFCLCVPVRLEPTASKK